MLYYAQLWLFHGCILSLNQFKGAKVTFHEWYLGKMGLHPNPQRLGFILNFMVPPLLVAIAVLVQNV